MRNFYGRNRVVLLTLFLTMAGLHRGVAQWSPVGPNNGTTLLGNGLFSPNSQGADYTVLAVDSLTGTQYVAYSDLGNSSKIAVKKYDGTAWVYVGAPFFSTGGVRYIDMAIDPTGVPYVVYVDGSLGSRSAVKKFDGTAWVNVGNPAGVNVGNSAFDKIAFSKTGTPYIAFVDYATSSGRLSIMSFNGTAWNFAAQPSFTAGVANSCALKIDNAGFPILAYGDAANANRMTVLRMVAPNVFTPIGAATGISAAAATKGVMTLDGNGNPYVVYADATQANRLTAKRWDGTTWLAIGTDGFTAGALTGNAVYNQTDIKLDRDGLPVVAYVDAAAANKVSAMRYNGTAWSLLGNAGFSTNPNNTKQMTMGRYQSNLYVSFIDLTNWTSTVMTYRLCTPSTAATITAGSTQVCLGQSTTLSVSTGTLNDATAWVWHRDSCTGATVGTSTQISVTPTATTTYYVRGEGGCTLNTPCTAVQITSLPLPAQPVISYVNGGLQSSYTTSNQWNLNGSPIAGANAVTYAPEVSGAYTVTYTNANGCQSTSAVYNAIVNRSVNTEGVDMWPNPAKKYVRIKFPTIISEFYVVVNSMESKKVLTQYFKNTGQILLNIESLQPGVYLVKVISTDGTTKTFRLIKGAQ